MRLIIQTCEIPAVEHLTDVTEDLVWVGVRFHMQDSIQAEHINLGTWMQGQ